MSRRVSAGGKAQFLRKSNVNAIKVIVPDCVDLDAWPPAAARGKAVFRRGVPGAIGAPSI